VKGIQDSLLASAGSPDWIWYSWLLRMYRDCDLLEASLRSLLSIGVAPHTGAQLDALYQTSNSKVLGIPAPRYMRGAYDLWRELGKHSFDDRSLLRQWQLFAIIHVLAGAPLLECMANGGPCTIPPSNFTHARKLLISVNTMCIHLVVHLQVHPTTNMCLSHGPTSIIHSGKLLMPVPLPCQMQSVVYDFIRNRAQRHKAKKGDRGVPYVLLKVIPGRAQIREIDEILLRRFDSSPVVLHFFMLWTLRAMLTFAQEELLPEEASFLAYQTYRLVYRLPSQFHLVARLLVRCRKYAATFMCRLALVSAWQEGGIMPRILQTRFFDFATFCRATRLAIIEFSLLVTHGGWQVCYKKLPFLSDVGRLVSEDCQWTFASADANSATPGVLELAEAVQRICNAKVPWKSIPKSGADIMRLSRLLAPHAHLSPKEQHTAVMKHVPGKRPAEGQGAAAAAAARQPPMSWVRKPYRFRFVADGKQRHLLPSFQALREAASHRVQTPPIASAAIPEVGGATVSAIRRMCHAISSHTQKKYATIRSLRELQQQLASTPPGTPRHAREFLGYLLRHLPPVPTFGSSVEHEHVHAYLVIDAWHRGYSQERSKPNADADADADADAKHNDLPLHTMFPRLVELGVCQSSATLLANLWEQYQRGEARRSRVSVIMSHIYSCDPAGSRIIALFASRFIMPGDGQCVPIASHMVENSICAIRARNQGSLKVAEMFASYCPVCLAVIGPSYSDETPQSQARWDLFSGYTYCTRTSLAPHKRFPLVRLIRVPILGNLCFIGSSAYYLCPSPSCGKFSVWDPANRSSVHGILCKRCSVPPPP
jgi:hypothetical protein